MSILVFGCGSGGNGISNLKNERNNMNQLFKEWLRKCVVYVVIILLLVCIAVVFVRG